MSLFLRFLCEVCAIAFCLQETWLSPAKRWSVPGFVLYREDRPTHAGGVAIGVSSRYPSRLLSLQAVIPGCEILSVQVWLGVGSSPLTLVSAYSPRGNFNAHDLQTYLDALPHPWLFLADLNAHSMVWDDGPRNVGGCAVETALANADSVILLNNGTSTMVHSMRVSAPDLSFVSSDFFQHVSWRVGPHLGSDHFPVVVDYRAAALSVCAGITRLRWDVFESDLQSSDPLSLTGDLGVDAQSFVGSLHRSSRVARGAPSPQSLPSPKSALSWWNRDCRLALCRRNQLFRAFKRAPSPAALTAYRRGCAVLRRTIIMAKRASWRSFAATLGTHSSLSSVWRVVHSLSGKRVSARVPGVLIAGVPAPSLKDISQAFTTFYSGFFFSPADPLVFSRISPPDLPSPLCLPFALTDLDAVLSATSNSSPGPDCVSYAHLRHLPLSHREYLLELFNASWRTGVIPDLWKTSSILPILKPGKSGTDVGHYRPITLTSTVMKVFEKLVVKRLSWHMIANGFWAEDQAGGRSGRSVYDNLLRLYQDCQDSISCKGYTVAVFLDLEKAFDSVRWEDIYQALCRYQFPPSVVLWIMSFLRDRQVSVRVHGVASSSFTPQRGVPQGSVLGPFLFCLVINGLQGLLRPSCSSFYIDDSSVWRSHHSLEVCCRDINASLTRLHAWAQDCHLVFNPLKSCVVVFTLRKQPSVHIVLGTSVLPQVTSTVFLGVRFHCRLNWHPYVTDVCVRVQQRLNVLRALSGSSWGASGGVLHTAYRMYVLPVIVYAAPFLFQVSPSLFSRLERLHSVAARIVTGLPRSTAISALLASACLPPLRDMCRARALGLAARMCFSWDPAVRRTMDSTPYLGATRHWTRSAPLALVYRRSALGHFCRAASVPCLSPPLQPFWILPLPKVTFHPFSRGVDSSPQARAISGILQVRAVQTLMVYTDGSRRRDGLCFSGFYVPSLGVLRTFALPSYCTSFDAEACAVLFSLQWLLDGPVHPLVDIVSDCQSFLLSLQCSGYRASQSPVSYEILCQLRLLSFRGCLVAFHWVPSHSGIPGNEAVDHAVRVEASADLSLIARVPLSRRALSQRLRRSVLTRWQESYLGYPGRLSRFVSQVTDRYQGVGRTRFEECLWHRWRCGRLPLRAHRFRLGLEPTALCGHCHAVDNEEHLFYACSLAAPGRAWLRDECQRLRIPFSEVFLASDGSLHAAWLFTFLSSLPCCQASVRLVV